MLPQTPITQGYFSNYSVHTHPRIRCGVSFRYDGIEYETRVRKVRQDYFVCCGKKYYFDRVINLKNDQTKEPVSKEMLQEWFPNM